MAVRDIQGIRGEGPFRTRRLAANPGEEIAPAAAGQVSDRVTLSPTVIAAAAAGPVVDVPYEIVGGEGGPAEQQTPDSPDRTPGIGLPARYAAAPDPSSPDRLGIAYRTEQWARTAGPLRSPGEQQTGTCIDLRI